VQTIDDYCQKNIINDEALQGFIAGIVSRQMHLLSHFLTFW